MPKINREWKQGRFLKRVAGHVREGHSLAVFASEYADLKRQAQSMGWSVNKLVNWTLMQNWHLTTPEPRGRK